MDKRAMYDHLAAEEAVRAAWLNPGANPGYHKRMQAEVRRKMPLLARALDRMGGQGRSE